PSRWSDIGVAPIAARELGEPRLRNRAAQQRYRGSTHPVFAVTHRQDRRAGTAAGVDDRLHIGERRIFGSADDTQEASAPRTTTVVSTAARRPRAGRGQSTG